MRRLALITIILLAFSLVLVACGGGDSETNETESSSTTAGDPVRGEELYKSTTIGSASAPGCITCHSLESGVVVIGPSHAGIGIVAGNRVSGQSAEEYLRESIVNPNAHVSENFSAGVMYQNYGRDLTGQEISDLVAFLLTLE